MSNDLEPCLNPPFFSKVHAPNIQVSDNGLKITRNPNSYNGLAFSNDPIQTGDRISLLVESNDSFHGDLRIGVTSNEPKNIIQLPKYSCPMLCGINGYWLVSVPDLQNENCSRITIYLTNDGLMQLFVNQSHKGAVLSKLPVKDSLWLVLDLFGKTTSLEFSKDEVIPLEISARGPNAVSAYKQIISSGSLPIYRTRLMLVGPKSSGKTSFRNLLVKSSLSESCGFIKSFDNSTINSVIDTSTFCVVGESGLPSDLSTWQQYPSDDFDPEYIQNQNKYEEESSENFVLEYEKNLEDEYHLVIAKNIVKELLQQKKAHEEKKKNSAGKARQLYFNRKTLSWRKNKQDSKKLIINDKKDLECKLNAFEMPDQIVDMVEKLLQKAEVKQDWDKMENEKQNNGHPSQISLNIWDWSGKSEYFTIQHLFFSSRAIYALIYDISKVFDSSDHIAQGEVIDRSNPYLSEIEFWLQAIYNHSTSYSHHPRNEDGANIQPKIILIGTHKNQIQTESYQDCNKIIDSKFHYLLECLREKPYFSCVSKKMLVLDICDNFQILESKISIISSHIEELLYAESYMGEEVPLNWLSFRNSICKLVESGVYCADFQMLLKVADADGIASEENLKMILQSLHDLGIILYFKGIFDSVGEYFNNFIILSPSWFMKALKTCLILSDADQCGLDDGDLQQLQITGKVNTTVISKIAAHLQHSLPVVIGLLRKFELICECSEINDEIFRTDYFIPILLKDNLVQRRPPILFRNNAIMFYYIFKGFVYESLICRLICRLIRWSFGGCRKFVSISHWAVKIGIEEEHTLDVEAVSPNKVNIVITRDSSVTPKKPAPEICALIRHFLESTLEDIRVLWEKRLTYQACVPCWCARDCVMHKKKSCNYEACFHFLPLDECLINNIVYCGYLRLKTNEIQSWFPEICKPAHKRSSKALTHFGSAKPVIRKPVWDFDLVPNDDLPSWALGAAKFLNAGSEGQDWAALAMKLGYKKKKISEFQDDFSPALMLISDWIHSSGNTKLSTDMMLSSLEEMHCSEVIELIKNATTDKDPPPIFISYQWDSQDEVLLIRNQLESLGYSCWMDVGQMGGGDLLYQQIYDGINNSKIFICCISPKYVVSNICCREVSLADALSKPMIPVMIESTKWPPPGAMGLIFSQLIYVSMNQNGGHGGSGKRSDWQTRMNEIVLQVSRYVASPVNAQTDSFIQVNNIGNKKDLQFHVDEVHGVSASARDSSDSLFSDNNVTQDQANNPNAPTTLNQIHRPEHCVKFLLYQNHRLNDFITTQSDTLSTQQGLKGDHPRPKWAPKMIANYIPFFGFILLCLSG